VPEQPQGLYVPQLGDAVANVQSVRNGTIGFTVVSASNLNQVVPGMDMFSLPYIFKNEQHFWWFLAQPEAESFVKQLEDNVAALDVKLAPAHLASLDELSKPVLGFPMAFLGRAAFFMNGGTISSGHMHPPSMPKRTPIHGPNEIGC